MFPWRQAPAAAAAPAETAKGLSGARKSAGPAPNNAAEATAMHFTAPPFARPEAPPDAPAGSPAAPELMMTPEGRLKRTSLTEAQRLAGMGLHLWWLALALPFGLLAPGIPVAIWLIMREKDPFIDDHGREALNFAISQVILSAGLAITVIGLLALPVLWICCLVSIVRGAVAAARGEYFRYPMTFRFLT